MRKVPSISGYVVFVKHVLGNIATILIARCKTTISQSMNVPSQESKTHVFVCYRSCICVLQVMYLCVTGHVFVCYRSCICVLQVMYLCVTGHVFVCYRSCICVLLVMYLCVTGIHFASFYNFSIEFWNCSGSVVFFFFFFFFFSIQSIVTVVSEYYMLFSYQTGYIM